MADNLITPLNSFVSSAGLEKINQWIEKYPEDQRQSAVMAALMVLQEEHGFLTDEAMTALADYLGMAPVSVFEIASFYTMYERAPVGRHVINVCKSISCFLNNADNIVKHLENKLNIKLGETTPDNRFTLRCAECLGACVNAPMMQIDKDYHEQLTTELVDAVLEQYK